MHYNGHQICMHPKVSYFKQAKTSKTSNQNSMKEIPPTSPLISETLAASSKKLIDF